MVRDEIWVKTDQLCVETRIFDRLPVFLLFNSIEYIRIYVHMYSLLIVVEYGSEYDHQ